MTFPAIGTHWTLRADEDMSEAQRAKLTGEVANVVDAFDKSFSRFRADSWVTKLSREAGTYKLPEYGHEMLVLYERLYRASDGLVSPLIGQTMVDAGYDADYTLRGEALTPPAAWDDVISYDAERITMSVPALLDFGAAGKGALVDIVGRLLGTAGLRSYTVDAGGDILHRARDAEPIVVGLEDPVDLSQVIGTVILRNQSLCASAGSRRRWGKYHHIINPRTLESPRDVLAAWAVASDTMTADGLATALFFVPAARLRRDFRFEYVVLRKDRSVEYSKDLQVEL